MNDFSAIDGFLNTFITYIDSGFGLISGDVTSLAAILIVIDVTLAALFWAWGQNDILQSLVKKTLYVGAFVVDGHRSLEELRSQINLKAQVVGMLTSSATDSDFRYDELARQLKSRQLNSFTRDTLLALLREEGLFGEKPNPTAPYLPIAIRSIMGPASDITGATPENTLALTDSFRQRYLHEGRDWQVDIRPRVEAFLADAAKRSRHLRVTLDAHASIAFLAGTVLDVKSGIDAQLVQKGRVGTRIWRTDDSSAGPRFGETVTALGSGRDLAVLISAALDVEPQARSYIAEKLPDVGSMLGFAFDGGPGQQSIAGGAHAVALAEQVANAIRRAKRNDPDATVHVFASVPNSLLFYLGQQQQAISPSIVYEFDFNRQGNKTYLPSFTMD